MESAAFLLPLQAYFEAFAQAAPGPRLALLVQSLTPDAEIHGPQRVFAGYFEIVQKIEGFQRRWPQSRLVIASGLNTFGRAGHFAMAIVGPDGAVLAQGHSVVELAPDGRICQVLAFWAPAAALPTSWPPALGLASAPAC